MEQSILIQIYKELATFGPFVLLVFGTLWFYLPVWKEHLKEKRQEEIKKNERLLKLLEDTNKLLILVENNLPMQQQALSNLTEIIQELLTAYNNKSTNFSHLEEMITLLAQSQLSKINELINSHAESRTRGQEWAIKTEKAMEDMPKRIKEVFDQ